jgi:GTP-binding protein
VKPGRAEFLTSAAGPEGYPPIGPPEIAFAGRSNVGKSSLLNLLIGKPLARTSSTPGRTRLVNFFALQQGGRPLVLVDLPGYGYAKVPVAMRASWRPLVESYLTDRSTLRGVVLLIDARRGAEDEERELVEYLGSLGTAVELVLTKGDKLAKNKRWPAAAAVRRELGLAREPLVVSAQTGDGVDELWRAIRRLTGPAGRPAARAP